MVELKMKKELLIKEQGAEATDFIMSYVSLGQEQNHVLKTTLLFPVELIEEAVANSIVNLNKINDIRGINDFFKTVNTRLVNNGLFIGCFESQVQRRKRILKKYPLIISQIYFLSDFIFKRVFPKLILTRWLYFFVTAGRNRVISKAESLGRLVFSGFDIKEVKEINGLTYFACIKTLRAIPEKIPSFGFFFKMQRVGRNNKPIQVYKIRTMHPYAEYLQNYIYEINNLKTGGKFKNDFRITSWGKILRKCWLDELPMIINLLKGEVKIVGVRPISSQYLNLYSEELKDKRKSVKPGLVPPFYADMPSTLSEIIRSEIAYIELYNKDPLTTDFKYFIRASKNILFNHARTN
jgi:lipopolysaccharide/colanic/teichoic acid biosynthesis glycosyltransferase